ncbi:MAG TPA: histidinol-phosphate transaminase [Chloroflexi bacterium]|nr:histidinol-phosphate transaminase [Chloroflexota bacterium]HCU97875.1 histidinol-phosphate transaminase [Chloroflexota bacterium]|tara:strand:- start:376 stop:1506 length:1131 start_codon:yes stop_codon:yes gene_type:complete
MNIKSNLNRTFSPSNNIRNIVRELEPYKPILPFEILSQQLGRSISEIIKLDANENLYGPSPLVSDVLSKLDFPHIYPDPENQTLRQFLSQYTEVPYENLFAGAGADEIIDLVIRLFIDPGDSIVDCQPTFGMYSFDGAVNGAQVLIVERTLDFGLDTEKLIEVISKNNPKILFIASPNNPDGNMITKEQLRVLLNLPIVVILDEAYVEFAGLENSYIKWVPENSNLIVLRTFSKWAGLAGLRVGYGAFPTEIIEELWKIKQPYNVSVAATAAAVASLKDSKNLLDIVSLIVAERERMYTLFADMNFLRPYPSWGNFILCEVQSMSASDLLAKLRSEGILVRYFDTDRLSNHIRISVGMPRHTDLLTDILNDINGSI